MKKSVLFLTGLLVHSVSFAQPYVCSVLTKVNGERVDAMAEKVDVQDGMLTKSIGKNPVYASAGIKLEGEFLMLEIHEDISTSPLKVVVVEAAAGGRISYFKSNSSGTTVKVTCEPL